MKKRFIVFVLLAMFVVGSIGIVPRKAEAFIFTSGLIGGLVAWLTTDAILSTITIAIIGGAAFKVGEDGAEYILEKVFGQDGEVQYYDPRTGGYYNEQGERVN